MFNKIKLKKVKEVSQEILSSLEDFSEENQGFYFNYDNVLILLQEAKRIMSNTLKCQRPKDLPEDFIWSEKPYNGEDFDIMVYDSSINIEDYKKLHNLN